MLEGLDDIDWSKLRHAYGPATNVPGLIRALASQNRHVREAACEDLHGNIFHQGTRYEASPYAVPFLFELAANPTVRDRMMIVVLILSAAFGYPETHLPGDFDIPELRRKLATLTLDEDATSSRTYGTRLSVLIACHDAVAKEIESLIPLLDDEDLNLRVMTAYALSWFPNAAPRSLLGLRALLERVSDKAEQAVIVAAVGMIARQTDATEPVLGFEAYLAPSEPPIVRVAASAALARDPLPAQALGILVEALRLTEPLPGFHDAAPYCFNGALADYAKLVLTRVSNEDRARVVGAVAMAFGADDGDRQSELYTETLLDLLTRGKDAYFAGKPASALTATERTALETIAAVSLERRAKGTFRAAYLGWLKSYGLPETPEELAAYLADD